MKTRQRVSADVELRRPKICRDLWHYVRAVSIMRTVLLLSLFVLAACGERYGPAPVVNWSFGDGARSSGVAKQRVEGKIKVRRGDSLYKIARRYGVSLRGLIDFNGLKPPYTIFPGQKLRLPSTNIHVVRRGETVYQIARIYNIEPGALVRLNGIQPPYRFSQGQRIRLPSGRAKTGKAAKIGRNTSTPSTRKRHSTSRSRAVFPSKAPKAKSAPRTSRAATLPPASRRGFIWPVSGRVVSRFGSIGKGLQNDGINILARKGTPVRAAQNGVVAYAGNELRGFGNLLLVKHEGGWISAYAHNSELLVRTGQKVRRGQVISRVGSTGSVDKPQLHFELRRGNRAVNPERYLSRQRVSLH
jgi:murein DD-endopeptidase MepM/ murein hydrolase activator NlpD